MSKPITEAKDLYNYVKDEYWKYDTELTGLHFDVEVSMKKKDILNTYRDIQRDINGDDVCRLNSDGSEADEFIPEGKYEDIYTGSCMEYLESFNDKNIFVRYCEGDRRNPVDFVF